MNTSYESDHLTMKPLIARAAEQSETTDSELIDALREFEGDPAQALEPVERALLDAVFDDQCQDLTWQQIGERIGIKDVRTLARIRAKPVWQAARVYRQGRFMDDNSLPVLKALAESAANPDPKHHQDRKLFLEMAGLHVPRSIQQKDETQQPRSERAKSRAEKMNAAAKRAESAKVIDLQPKPQETEDIDPV